MQVNDMPVPLLQSWKEIALYLQVGVRTAQRWEKTLGLPVHHTGIKGRVFAVREELDKWLGACPKRGNSEFALDLLDQITDGVYALDREWRFVYVNTAAARTWNVDRYSLIGKNMWEVLPRLAGSEMQEALMRVATTGSRVQFEASSPLLATKLDVVAYPLRNGGVTITFHEIAAAASQHKKATKQTGAVA